MVNLFYKQLSYPPSYKYGFLSLNLTVYLFIAYLGSRYISLRNNYMIAPRNPFLMILYVFGNCLTVILQSLPQLWQSDFFCLSENRPVIWLWQLSVAGSFVIPVGRFFDVIYKSEVQQKIIAQLKHKNHNSNFIKLLSGKVTKYIIKIFIFFIVIIPTLSEITGVVRVHPVTKRVPIDYCDISDIISTVFAFISAFSMVFLSFLVQNISENFNLIFELQVCAVGGIVHFFIYLPLILYLPGLSGSLFINIYLLIVILFTACMIFVYPLIKINNSVATRRKNSIAPEVDAKYNLENKAPAKRKNNSLIEISHVSSIDDKKIGLEKVLSIDLLRDAFRDHLGREFSAEILMFLLEIQEYNNFLMDNLSNDVKNVSKKSSDIYCKYMLPSSQFQINLPGSMLTVITTFFNQNPLPTERSEYISIFDAPYKEVFRLAENDTFLRFKETKIFKDLVNQRHLMV